MPEVVVLIPHYNNIAGLRRSLRSISSEEPVDVFIVDDGSKKKPEVEILRAENPQINNIDVIYLEKNVGIENALNSGLGKIKQLGCYKYVARLDCGDSCVAERFKVQKQFMENNSEIYLVGSWADFVDLQGKSLYVLKCPTEHNTIKRKMFLNCMLIHPTVMFRSSAIDVVGYYPTIYKYAEDYAYFLKFVKVFCVANIPQILVVTEVNPEGISLAQRKTQVQSRIRVMMDNYNYSLYASWGILRSIILLLLPYSMILRIKKAIVHKV